MRFGRRNNIVKAAVLIFSAAAAQIALPGAVLATDCNLSGLTGINFGNTSSINSSMSVTVPGSVTCSGYPNSVTRGNALPICLSVFPVDSVDASIAANEGKRAIWLNGAKGAANSKAIKFDLIMANYSDGGCANNCAWGGGAGPFANYGVGFPAFATPPRSGGKTSEPRPISIAAASPGGQDLAAGYYSGSFRLRLNWDDSQGSPGGDRTIGDHNGGGGKVRPDLLCSRGMNPTGGSHTQEKWYTMTMAATVKEACSLSASAIAFQSNILLNAVPPATGNVHMRCDAGRINYQIGISNGNYPDSYGTRSMRCDDASKCGASQIQYLLYKDSARTQLWNNNWNTNGVLSGSCNGGCEKDIPVYAAVVKAATPPAGPYRDQVTVTLMPAVAP